MRWTLKLTELISLSSTAVATTEPEADRQAYEHVLRRLCDLAEVPPADHDVVLSREAIILGSVVIAFQFEPRPDRRLVWSGGRGGRR